MSDLRHRSDLSCLRLGLVALLVAISATAQAQTKITAGLVAHGPPQWPQYIADELGWHKEAGLELDYITVGSGGAQQLASGSLNIAHSGYPDFARAALQGADERIILNDITASPYGIFAKTTIKQIADLKGKVISIGGPNDLTPPTYFKATSAGLTHIGDTATFAPSIPFTVWGANAGWAAKNRDALVAFAKSYRRAVQWLYDPANKAKAIDILVKHAKQDAKDSAEAYDFLVTKLKLFGRDGDVPDAAYEKMAEGLADIGIVKKPYPAKSAIVDGSFVQAAAK